MPDAQPDLSAAPLALGIYGKMPAHGDFVRRGLPSSFVTPWDDWLSAGVAAARDQLAEGFASVWDEAPAWRFSLPAGVCGPDAVAGVMLPSEDTVGRRFPLTAAALLPPGVVPEETWFARLEAAVRAARQGVIDADGMIRAMQSTPEPLADAQAAPGDVLGMLGDGMALGGAVVLGGAAAVAQEARPWGKAADPMDGPAEADPPAPASDMWGALLGEPAPDAKAAPDPMEGPAPAAGGEGWGALIGADPIAAPSAGAEPAQAPLKGGEDMWGDLLGEPAAEARQAALDSAAADHWDELIGDASAAPHAAATGGDADAEDAQPETAAMGAGDDPGADGRAAPPAAMAAPASALLPATTAPPPHAPEADAPPRHAPVRPPEGGWWTLGGAHLAPMVWPLPALPPAESFILLLNNQDPESGA